MQSYDVYLSRAEQIQVSMTKPDLRHLSVKEQPFPLQDFGDVVDGYNAYSPPGRRDRQLVYANYGLPEDYAELDKLGVSVAGKIVIVRYGGSFRGVKVHLAEQHGAKGVIIYSDPEDDGYVKGTVYPEGPWRPADSIQRGSIQFLWDYPGDPLTPGKPSIPGTKRLEPGPGDGPREDPEHADLLRRGAAVAAGARRAGGAGEVPGRPAVPLPRRPGPDRGAPEPRHRLRHGAGQQRDRGHPRDHAPRREGHGRRPLGRLDLRHRTTTSAAGRR